MNLWRFLCPVLMLSTLYLPLIAQSSFSEPTSLFEVLDQHTIKEKQKDFISEEQYLLLNQKIVSDIQSEKPERFVLTLPASLELAPLELKRTNIFAGGYQLQTSDGRSYHSENNYTFYQGEIKGEKQSLVAITFFNDEVKILISNNHENYRIHKLKDNPYVFFKESKVKQKKDHECATVDSNEDVHFDMTDELKKSTALIGNCVEIYFECDYDSFLKNGSNVSSTESWLAALFNEVQAIYNNEAIPVNISEAFIWTSPDPYATLNNSFSILNQFQLNKNATGFNGRLAHFLSTRNLGSGIAFVDVLCSNSSNYAVSTSLETNVMPFPEYSWNVNVISHEMGHNFGSRHTHACVWNGNNTQIDDCGNQIISNPGECYDESNPILPITGTMMSYCHVINGVGIDFSLGFGEQPGALIRDRYTNSSCSTGDCLAPYCVEMVNPISGSINVDHTTSIDWSHESSASGYLISIGTTPTNGSIVNQLDVGLSNTYITDSLPFGVFLYVQITPYNDQGTALDCPTYSFETESDTSPECVTLSYPLNGSQNIDPSIMLSWPDAIGNELGYLLSIGTTDGGGEIIDQFDVGDVQNYQLENLPIQQEIFVQVSPYGTNGDASLCDVSSFTTNNNLQYCSGEGAASNFEWIEKFSCGSFEHISGNSDGYGDYTEMVISVNAGHSYALNVEPGFSGQVVNEYYKVWIDLNRDGDFEEIDELIFEAGPSSNSVLGLITIPDIVSDGLSRMRVAMKFNGSPNLCESFSYGEVEDYTVLLSTEATCNLVTTTNETGPGSLMDAINCSVVGDTILFDSSLVEGNIELITTFAVINQNVVIQVNEGANLSLYGTGTSTVFHVLENASLHLIGLNLIAGNGPEGTAIINEGTLILENVDIIKNPLTNGSIINNTGSIEIRGSTAILDY